MTHDATFLGFFSWHDTGPRRVRQLCAVTAPCSAWPNPAAVSVDRHEDRVPHLATDRLRQVALAAYVLDQDYLAGADLPHFLIARRNPHAGIEVDDVLPSRRR